MPSPTTAQAIIEGACRLTRAVGVDQTLTATEVADCLEVFNDLKENWSTQKLAVYGQANQTFNTVAGQKVYTIGSGGNWNTSRPIRIDQPAYSSLPVGAAQPATFPCLSMTQEEYNLIGIKDQTQEYPDRYLYVNEYPLGLITLWPVPSQVTPITFSIDRILAQSASAATSVSFPEGYVLAFKYNLSLLVAPIFGKPIPPDVREDAIRYLADIKRANRVTPRLQYDPALQQDYPTDWRQG